MTSSDLGHRDQHSHIRLRTHRVSPLPFEIGNLRFEIPHFPHPHPHTNSLSGPEAGRRNLAWGKLVSIAALGQGTGNNNRPVWAEEILVPDFRRKIMNRLVCIRVF